MLVRVWRVALAASVLSVLSAGCGSSDGETPPIAFSPVAPAKALSVPGATCTMYTYCNSARRVSTDASGAAYLAAVCGGHGYAAVSLDGARTFDTPVGLPLAGLTHLTVQGGPAGVAYAVATTTAGEAYFTRTVDQGATWDTPVVLATGIANTDQAATIATRGDQVLVLVNSNGRATVYRNASRGSGAFASVALPSAVHGAFFGLLVDGAGRIWAALDNPDLYLSGSTDGGATFPAWVAAAPGGVVYSSWDIGADLAWVAGTNTSAYRIAVATPTVATEVTGLPATASIGETSVAVDDAGRAFVANGDGVNGVVLQSALAADTAFGIATSVDAAGRYPTLATPPGAGRVIVAYEKAGEIWTAVY